VDLSAGSSCVLPNRRQLLRFAVAYGMPLKRAEVFLSDVAAGVDTARDELIAGIREIPEFTEAGGLMLKAWDEGLLALKR